jgi:lysophospholipase L1-like esterase
MNPFKLFSYLALGDSYTIGEQVKIAESFPYQTVQLLRKNGMAFVAPEIVAITGWTTDELSVAIDQHTFLPKYDIVSLLIGVNNQYRGRSASEFTVEFDHLLQRAIQLAGNNASHVIVLSIPDWGVTPFAAERDKNKIAEEIDAFNLVCKLMAEKYQIHFIDITTSQREDGNKEEFLADDKLHPSGKEYAKWAGELKKVIISAL